MLKRPKQKKYFTINFYNLDILFHNIIFINRNIKIVNTSQASCKERIFYHEKSLVTKK